MNLSQSSSDYLWTRLEIAVRTYGQRLPVDAFWEPAGRWVERLQQARARQRPSELSDESGGSEEPDASFLENVEHEEVETLEHGSDGPEHLDEALRNQMSGRSFAELDDVEPGYCMSDRHERA
jgi:hypothetical protein